MKINIIQSLKSNSNTNFGNDKKANADLKKAASNMEEAALGGYILELQRKCNSLEKDIVVLEGKNQADVERNIQVLKPKLDLFCKLKKSLFILTEFSLPDVDFASREMEAYDEEQDKIESAVRKISRYTKDRNSDVYNWRYALGDDSESIIYDFKSKIDAADCKCEGESRAESLYRFYIPNPDSPRSLDDVLGNKSVKDDLRELVVEPIKDKTPIEEKRRKYGKALDIPGFICLYGPPGCGKTMLVQALASETGCKMIQIDSSTIGGICINETSKNIRMAFENIIEKAKKENKPIIVFFDEMDSILSSRSSEGKHDAEDSKAVNTLLPILDNAKYNNIIIIGATNLYNNIDPAVKRRCNYDEGYIGLPNIEEIKEILVKTLSDFELGQELLNQEGVLEELSKILKGYSPSDIINKITPSATRQAYKEQRGLKISDFNTALKKLSLKQINEKEYKSENTIIGFISN